MQTLSNGLVKVQTIDASTAASSNFSSGTITVYKYEAIRKIVIVTNDTVTGIALPISDAKTFLKESLNMPIPVCFALGTFYAIDSNNNHYLFYISKGTSNHIVAIGALDAIPVGATLHISFEYTY